MKDEIILWMGRHKNIAEENIKRVILYDSKQIEQAKIDTWEQAIAIVEEVMKGGQ